MAKVQKNLGWRLLIASCCLIGLLVFAHFGLAKPFTKAAKQAHLIKANQELAKIDLETSPAKIWTFQNLPEFKFETDGNGKIRIKSATCLDQQCVAVGWLDQAGDVAICLPNQFILQLD